MRLRTGILLTIATFVLSAVVTYLLVTPLVPLAGWEWLIGGFVALVVAVIVAIITWTLVVVQFIANVRDEADDMVGEMDKLDDEELLG